MTNHGLPRREFLLQALAACGAPFVADAAFARTAQTQRPVNAERGAKISAVYLGAGSVEAARTIGEAFLKHLNVERSHDAIVAAANDTLELIARAPGNSAAITALVQGVRRDFRSDRVVQLEGWVLSRTELDLCLLALLPDVP
jgi:hypothetical protein